MSKAKICLNMIVKDEAHVIERCLRSVAGFIDTWVIVDTGSSDGTPRVIENFMKAAGIPGEVVSRPWRDFGTNRSEALELARPRADYTLIIDADEVFEVSENFAFPELDADAYQILHGRGGSETTFWLTQLVKSSLPFRYQGVLHEVIVCDAPHRAEKLAGAVTRGYFDSARNKLAPEEKYLKDALVFEKALEEEPNNARYVFYLAQSYRDAKKFDEAVVAYERRSRMGGFEEEAWYSELQMGRLFERLGKADDAVRCLLSAYERRPTRAESLYDLARHHREKKSFHLAYLFAGRAMEIEVPREDLLFIEDSVYKYRALDERAVAAYWCGKYSECEALCLRLLDEGHLPENERQRIEKNLAFSVAKRSG